MLNSPVIALDTDVDVMLIHGVGNAKPRALAASVVATLQRGAFGGGGKIRVAECNWNQIAEPSARGGEIQRSAWEDLSINLAHASAIGGDTHGPRLVRVLSGLGFMLAELGIAGVASAVLLAAPLILVFSVITERPDVWDLSVRWLPFAVRTGSVATVAGLAGMLLVGCVEGALVRSMQPLYVETRRALIVTLRPFLVSAVYFFLVPWRRLIDREWLALVFQGLQFSLVITLVGLVLGRFTPSEVFKDTPQVISFILGLGVASLAIVFVTVAVVAPALKVLLDIFRYVGSAEYRAKIQAHLAKIIAELRRDGANRPLYIISHSLGTVIALDSLVSSPTWSCADRVTLVTLGSPLRRLFMRFFPGLFFPPMVDAVAKIVASRVGQFRWVNCYRPLDQVGAALGFSALPYTHDASTGQWRRIWDAHPDYWSDECVRDVITKAVMATPAYVHAGEALGYEAPDLTTGDAIERFRARVVTSLIRTAVVTILAMPILAVVVVIHTNRQRSVKRTAAYERIASKGLMTKASITHWRVVEPRATPDEPILYTDNFEIVYRTLDGSLREVALQKKDTRVFEEITYQMDSGALVHHIRDRCTEIEAAVPLTGSLSRRCRADGIMLRYDPASPEHFLLPEFPSRRPWWITIWDSAWALGGIFLGTGMVMMLLVMTVGHFVSHLLGVRDG